jgi:predicted DCC family thiol-disulfide oxidoreductase YuxK
MTVLYDASCPLCLGWKRRLERLDAGGRLAFRPTQDAEWVRDHAPDLTPEALERALHVVEADGRVWRGFFAVRRILETLPATRMLGALMHLPGAARVGSALYGWVASRRRRDACALHGGAR